jgi:uncharacterized LabA/DUF88 family protein
VSKSNPTPKTAIFIDYSNVFIHGRKNFGITIDPPKLISLLSKLFKVKNLVHSYYFSSEDPNNQGQKNFHIKMKKLGIIVETVELVERPGKVYCKNCMETIIPTNCPNCGEEINIPPHKSKRIDVLLAATLLRSCNTYDEIILVGGDQDFIPIINILRKEEGKKVYIASFKKPLSNELQTEVDDIKILDSYVDKIKR